MNAEATSVLEFWFAHPKQWFSKDAKFDEEVRTRFLGLYERAARGELDGWTATPEGALAVVILLDQLSRNMFRDDPRAFATDNRAVTITREAIANGQDRVLDPKQRGFLYMPLMHSERREDQARSVELFESLGQKESADYARRHQAIIERFGRFPHRNAVLGRTSTPEEEAFLKEPHSSF